MFPGVAGLIQPTANKDNSDNYQVRRGRELTSDLDTRVAFDCEVFSRWTTYY